MKNDEPMSQGQIDEAKLRLERTKVLIDARLKRRELQLKTDEARRSKWANPLVLAVVAAALATFGNAAVTWMSGRDQQALEATKADSARQAQATENRQQISLESLKAESDRILEAMKTGSPDKAAVNLQFLLDAGLINNKSTADYLKTYLANRQPGEGAALAVPNGNSTFGPVTSSDVKKIVSDGYIMGIDAGHMTAVDFSKLSSHGIAFAYLKSSEGGDFVDAKVEERAGAASQYGVKVGLYHVFKPDTSVDKQAANFLARLGAVSWQLPPAIDVVDGISGAKLEKSSYSAAITEFAKAIQSATGVTPVIYTSAHIAETLLDSSVNKYPLWLYGPGLKKPQPPKGWQSYVFWQVAWGVNDDPVLKHLDLNAFRGTAEDLSAIGRPQHAATASAPAH